MDDEPKGRAKGGIARAARLSPEERQGIASRAAAARWGDRGANLPKETHRGKLRIGDREMACSVLDNGIRVFSGRALYSVMGASRRGDKRDPVDGGARLPSFLDAERVKAYIPNDLMVALTSPIQFRPKRGGGIAFGYEATLLPKICNAILDARNADRLTARQKPMAVTAEVLVRGFAEVGVIALVDEATGYQEIRDRDALQRILDHYIGRELAKWAKRFPDEFYEQMFRLKGWAFNPNSSKRPMAMARVTIDLVFDRIGPGLTKNLRERRAEIQQETGKRGKLHQVLTVDVGHPALQHHLSGLIFLGKSFPDRDWLGFYAAVDRVAPRFHRTMSLPFDDDVIDLARPSAPALPSSQSPDASQE
jgi:hypothetical protein